MQIQDRVYLFKFSADPEFESIYEDDELYDFDFNKNPDKSQDDIDFDDTDELSGMTIS